MNKKVTIGVVAAVLILGGGSAAAATYNNHEVQLHKAQVAKVEAADYKKLLTTANTAVDTAYKTQKAADIQTAQADMKKLKSADQKPLTTRLTELTTGLAAIRTATNAVATAEKAKSGADAKVALEQKAAAAQAATQTMNLQQIAQQNFSSIVGTWATNNRNRWDPATFTVTDNSLGNFFSFITSQFQWANDVYPTIGADGSLALDIGADNEIILFPKGVADKYGGDTTKNRIEHISSDGASSPITSIIYYQTGDTSSITISSADQTTIKNDVNTAQTAIDKITWSWAKVDKTVLQAQLDKVRHNLIK